MSGELRATSGSTRAPEVVAPTTSISAASESARRIPAIISA
jgi:hypothetical protein